MKIKLKDLKPNPYKQQINKGKLNEVQVEEISGNLDELGLMGAIPIVKIDGNYHLVNSHHRVEALKRKFGGNYEIEVILHSYSDDQLLKGMVVENLSQRGSDFHEEVENIRVVENYLNKNKDKLEAVRESRNAFKSNFANEKRFENATARDVQSWLKLSKEKWGDDTILSIMNIYKKLDASLLEKTDYVRGGQRDKPTQLSVEDAKNLSRLEKQDQHKIRKILEKTGLDNNGKSKLVTAYNKTDAETKRLIKENKISIINIVDELRNSKGVIIKTKPKNVDEKISELNDLSVQYSKKLGEFAKTEIKNCSKNQLNFLKLHVTGVLEQLRKFADKIQEEQ